MIEEFYREAGEVLKNHNWAQIFPELVSGSNKDALKDEDLDKAYARLFAKIKRIVTNLN